MKAIVVSSARRAQDTLREVRRLRLFSFFAYATLAIVISFFPLYYQSRGFSAQQIGLLYSLGPALSIVANVLTGLASDKFRTIRKILAVLLIGQLLALALLLPVNDFLTVCILMGAFYFFQMPISALNDSMILLSVPHTGRSYPAVRVFGSLGFATTALVAGFFLRAAGADTTLIVAMLTVAIALACSFTLRDYQGGLNKFDFSGLLRLLRNPQLIYFFAIILVLSIAHRMNEAFLAVIMRDMGADESLVGFAWMMSAASEIPMLFLLGKYGHRFKELPLLAVASFMYGARFFFLSLMNEPHWAVLIQAMHSVSFAIFMSTALRYMTYLIPDEYRASGQALYAVVWMGLAGLLSGLLGGAVIEAFGYEAFFQLGIALSLAAAAGFLLLNLRTR